MEYDMSCEKYKNEFKGWYQGMPIKKEPNGIPTIQGIDINGMWTSTYKESVNSNLGIIFSMYWELLETINKKSSIKEKQILLEVNKDHIILKEIIQYAYHPDWNYGINNITKDLLGKNGLCTLLRLNWWNDIKNLLDQLKTQKITGNKAREEIIKLFSDFEPYEQNLLLGIINKDLKMGIGVDIILKVWKDLIPTFSS